MKDAKFFRLLLGLIILFSIFLFQGSEDHHRCTQCEEDRAGGTLRVVNNTRDLIIVYIIPAGRSSDIRSLDFQDFDLYEGLYHVMATTLLMPYSGGKIVGVRMVDIKLGSDKTIRFE